MSAEVVIRDLGRDDLESLLTLYRHLHEHDDPLPDRAEVEAIWRTIVGDPGQIYLGAFLEGSLVAACNASIVPNLTRGTRPYAVIENVVTDAAYRRRGIGARVLRTLLDRCWSRHCYKIMLMSGASVRDSRIYESLGFEVEAGVRDQGAMN